MKLRSRRNLGFGKIPKVPFVASVSKLVSLPDGSIFRWARCGKCFKGEVIASPSQAADVLDAMAKRRRAM